jgi:GT2 family glycosyltransferase
MAAASFDGRGLASHRRRDAQAMSATGVLQPAADYLDSTAPEISISVVSHAQIGLVMDLFDGLQAHCQGLRIELILTLNLEETLPFDPATYSFPISVLENTFPKGFAANQNQAFSHARGRYFCVLNPDIRLDSNPFKHLLACLENSSVGVVAPLVKAENGDLEVTARRFPSPLKLLGKLFGTGWVQDYRLEAQCIYPDWVGGMFMLFSRGVFAQLKGFDERYFLYYEDVDICARLKLQGYQTMLCPTVSVTHHARRQSHRELRYLKWHLSSIVRFFLSAAYWKLQLLQKP